MRILGSALSEHTEAALAAVCLSLSAVAVLRAAETCCALLSIAESALIVGATVAGIDWVFGLWVTWLGVGWVVRRLWVTWFRVGWIVRSRVVRLGGLGLVVRLWVSWLGMRLDSAGSKGRQASLSTVSRGLSAVTILGAAKSFSAALTIAETTLVVRSLAVTLGVNLDVMLGFPVVLWLPVLDVVLGLFVDVVTGLKRLLRAKLQARLFNFLSLVVIDGDGSAFGITCGELDAIEDQDFWVHLRYSAVKESSLQVNGGEEVYKLKMTLS